MLKGLVDLISLYFPKGVMRQTSFSLVFDVPCCRCVQQPVNVSPSDYCP